MKDILNLYDRYNVILKYIPNDNDEQTYITDHISEIDVNLWKKYQPVFISAQTGSGKNTFVKNVLITTFDKKNYKKKKYFLYLVNRTALKEQLKKDLKESLKTETIEDYDKFVYVFTYQEFKKEIYQYESKIKKMIESGKIKYVVMDECHFFLSDSVFNPHTHFLLEYLIKNLREAVRVYMSATLEDVTQVILESEYKEHPDDFSCLYYYFERNYNYIENIYAYREFNEIENIIKDTLETSIKQKFVVFVSQKSKGKKLNASLNSQNISSVFISSETKTKDAKSEDYSQYEYIIEKEKFKSQVLIATSVLDNGITIKDKNVVNVLIDVFDRVEMLQMIGRIRVKKNQKINLYLRDYSFEELEELHTKTVKALFCRLMRNKRLEEYSPEETLEFFLNKLEGKFTTTFMITNHTTLFDYNQCAIYQLILKLHVLREVLTAISGKEYAIDSEKLDYEENRVRSNVFGKYAKLEDFENYIEKRYTREFYESLCREVALENELPQACNFKDIKTYSFLPYLCHSIQYLQIFYFLNKMGYSTDKRILDQSKDAMEFLNENTYVYIEDGNLSYQQNFKKMFEILYATSKMYLHSIRDLKSSPFPALEVQLLWLGRNRSDYGVKYLSPILQLLALSDNEIETLMDDFAITADDYEKYVSKDLKHSSNTLYQSFSNQNLLKKNGFLKKKTKNLVEEIKDNQFAKIIYWLIHKYKVHEKGIMAILISRMEQQPFVGSKGYYKIRLVRETIEPQEYYYILVRE